MIDPDRAAALRETLQARHASGESYRQIAETFPPIVKHGVICNIIAYGTFPKERRILQALGLVERRQRTETEKAITKMARETREAVLVVKHE